MCQPQRTMVMGTSHALTISSLSDADLSTVVDVNNYRHPGAIEVLNTMNRQLQALHEKYMELSVRSHLLEVDLATQFSPDMILALQKMEESCQQCKDAMQDFDKFCEESSEFPQEGVDHPSSPLDDNNNEDSIIPSMDIVNEEDVSKKEN